MRTPTPAARPRAVRRTLRLLALAAVTVALTSGCTAREAYEKSFHLGFPSPITDRGENVYNLWLGTVAAAAVVGLFVIGLILWACFRYRKRSDELPRQVRYNLPVEVLYTVIPLVIVSVLFYYTAVSQNYVNEESKNPDVTIQVIGFQWNWQFVHDDNDPSTPDPRITGVPGQPAVLVLPVDRSIRFNETSNDVIHSFWVPKFLFKRDVFPGSQKNSFELTIKEQGTYIGRCAELCGEKHDRMNFYVKVVSGDAYDTYIKDQRALLAKQGDFAPNPSQPDVAAIVGDPNSPKEAAK